MPVSNWSKEKNSKVTHGIDTKDCFHNKSPRVMIADQIKKQEKKRAIPPLGTHSPKYLAVEPRIRNLPRSSVERGQLTADAEFQGLQTPSFKYDFVKGEKLTQPKTLFAKIYDKRKDPNEHKLKKDGGPDMGTYNSPLAYDSTQGHSIQRRGIKIHAGTKKTYLDEAPKTTKFVPSPGHYRHEQAYAKLSQSPRSIRIHRH